MIFILGTHSGSKIITSDKQYIQLLGEFNNYYIPAIIRVKEAVYNYILENKPHLQEFFNNNIKIYYISNNKTYHYELGSFKYSYDMINDKEYWVFNYLYNKSIEYLRTL